MTVMEKSKENRDLVELKPGDGFGVSCVFNAQMSSHQEDLLHAQVHLWSPYIYLCEVKDLPGISHFMRGKE